MNNFKSYQDGRNKMLIFCLTFQVRIGWSETISPFYKDMKPFIIAAKFCGILYVKENKIKQQENKDMKDTPGFSLSTFLLIYSFLLYFSMLSYLEIYGYKADYSIGHLKLWIRFIVPSNLVSLLILNLHIIDIINRYDSIACCILYKNKGLKNKKKPYIVILLYLVGAYYIIQPFKRVFMVLFFDEPIYYIRETLHTAVFYIITLPHKFIFVFFIYFSSQLYKELKQVHEALKNFKDDKNSVKYFFKATPTMILENIRIIHRKIFCLCQKLNSTFGFMLLQMYISLFPEIFDFIFELLYSDRRAIQLSGSIDLCVFIITIYFTSHFGERIIGLVSFYQNNF